MKYEDLLLELENNLVLCVKQMFEYLSDNNIEIFAFTVDITDDLSYISFLANSIKNLNTEDKWFPSEFDLELSSLLSINENNDKILKKIKEVVGNSFENFDESLYEKTKKDIVNTVINALKKAKIQINIDVSNIVFFVTMFSADDKYSIEKYSSSQLNNKEILSEFHELLS